MIETPGKPSGLGFPPDGSLIVVSIHERKLYRFCKGELGIHADLAGVAPSMINDMVVDSGGRAYVGSIGYDFFARGSKPSGWKLPAQVHLRAPARIKCQRIFGRFLAGIIAARYMPICLAVTASDWLCPQSRSPWQIVRTMLAVFMAAPRQAKPNKEEDGCLR